MYSSDNEGDGPPQGQEHQRATQNHPPPWRLFGSELSSDIEGDGPNAPTKNEELDPEIPLYQTHLTANRISHGSHPLPPEYRLPVRVHLNSGGHQASMHHADTILHHGHYDYKTHPPTTQTPRVIRDPTKQLRGAQLPDGGRQGIELKSTSRAPPIG